MDLLFVWGLSVGGNARMAFALICWYDLLKHVQIQIHLYTRLLRPMYPKCLKHMFMLANIARQTARRRYLAATARHIVIDHVSHARTASPRLHAPHTQHENEDETKLIYHWGGQAELTPINIPYNSLYTPT